MRRFDKASIEARWEELWPWVHDVLRTWTQRCKERGVERQGDGIRIRMQTQDERGYYNYASNVLPRREG